MMQWFNKIQRVFRWPWRYRRNHERHMNLYYTFKSYRRIWSAGVVVLMATAILPLILTAGVWFSLRVNIMWCLGFSAIVLMIVIPLAVTVMIDRIYRLDRAKAKAIALAQQQNQLASIGHLSTGVAHEINNPLALINEAAGYLKDLFLIKKQYREDKEVVEHIDSILDAVDRCGTTTRQLLGFVRRFDIHAQPFDLKALVNDVLKFHRQEAKHRNIALHVKVPENTPLMKTDRGKMQQVLLNLVNNAFQVIGNGCYLAIQVEMSGLNQVHIRISDNGPGISEENLGKVFEPFFTTKTAGRGMGLGLSVAYDLVRKLHGDIAVQSQEGRGTIFDITLPVHIEKKDE